MQSNRSLAQQRAFTLIELMVVIAIIAVVATLAAPSFKELIEMQRLRGVQDQLATDMEFARSEATKLGMPVHVAAKNSGTSSACYVLYSDPNLNRLTWDATCDCTAAAGARCTDNTMTELRTVQLQSSHRILMSFGSKVHFAFDHVTGALLFPEVDSGVTTPTPANIDISYDRARKLRGAVGLSGRMTTCAPSGSKIQVPAC